jgi:putative transposase
MKGTRKRYPASFKARVAPEATKQTMTLAELSTRYQVHSVQISQSKKKRLIRLKSALALG